ncbi:MAG TPA: MFS transporter [Thermoplasmata archaeon]|nr:MFS transporter [Thermoplasmata archaeon]
MDGGPRATYRDVLRHDSMPAFLTAGALQFAAPATALVVLIFSIPGAYARAGHPGEGALALALLGLSSALPTLASAFFAGPLADRHDRHYLLRTANVVSLLATALLAADLYARPGGDLGLLPGFYLPLWIALALPAWALLISSATVFRPAFNASVPRLVPAAELGRANGLIYAIAAGTSAAASLLVGVVLSVGSSVYALAVPFLLFLATQVALVGVRADLSAPRPRPVRRIWPDVVEGLRYLYGRRDLFEMTVAALVVNFLVAIAFVELGLYVLVWLGLASGVWYGAMVAASTAGAAVGMVAIAHLRFEERAGRVLIGLVLAMGFAVLGLALVHSVWFALPIVFVYGLLPGMVQTVFLSSVQATVPNEILGRVFSADEVGSYALVPVGQATGGVISFEVGVQGTFLAAGSSIVALGLVMAAGFGALRALRFDAHPAARSSGSAAD